MSELQFDVVRPSVHRIGERLMHLISFFTIQPPNGQEGEKCKMFDYLADTAYLDAELAATGATRLAQCCVLAVMTLYGVTVGNEQQWLSQLSSVRDQSLNFKQLS